MKRSLPMFHNFIVEHPFFFALYCKKSGSIHFAGRISEFEEDTTHDEL